MMTHCQGLIESRVEPEVFTTRLQKELNSSPQPCLVPFLKKSLPYLQVSSSHMLYKDIILMFLVRSTLSPLGSSLLTVLIRPV